MVLMGLDQSEQGCEGIFRHHKKRDWNFSGSFIARDRGWDWIGEPASSGDHQYPHHAFFFDCNSRGFNHSVVNIHKEREQVDQMLGQFEGESMEEEDTLPKLDLVTSPKK